MANTTTKIAQAMRYKREAYTERLCKPNPVLAEVWERKAAELIILEQPSPIGAGGEVLEALPAGYSDRTCVRDTLAQGATQIAEDASIRRTDLLMRPSFNAVALGVDAADTMGAQNSLEKMLAHQMAVLHEA